MSLKQPPKKDATMRWTLRQCLPASPTEWIACVATFALFGVLCWEVTHPTELQTLVFRALAWVGV